MAKGRSEKLRRAIRINKAGAAEAQLNTAIWLWFHHGDPVAIHMLAVAAHDCFYAMGKIAARPSVYGEWARRQPKTVQWFWIGRKLSDVQRLIVYGRGEKTVAVPAVKFKSSLDFRCEGEIVRLASAMDKQSDKEIAGKKQRDQMLQLVARGFYNELTNYGVRKHEIVQVASHLLDNLLATEKKPAEGMEYYSGIFTLASVRDEWVDRKQLAVQHVTLRPLQLPDVSKVIVWLQVPAVRESFVPLFPENQSELRKYFTHPTREYFGVYYNDQLVGIVGGENIDLTAGKLEMKKLVGESGLQGKGIGKRATFGFLYYAFMIRNLNKVYIHSRDINMRNINLNSRFGFELEGVFLDDITIRDKHQDVLRMALFKSLWLQIFSRGA